MASQYMQHTGQFPFCEEIIFPRYIVAHLYEETWELHITEPKRFDQIVADARVSLNAFYSMMIEKGLEQVSPYMTWAVREGHASRNIAYEDSINEDARAYQLPGFFSCIG